MADHLPPQYQSDEDRYAALAQPGDSRSPGDYDASRKGRSPDDRSTEPDAAVTNHDHPLPIGSKVVGVPGAGLVDTDATKPSPQPVAGHHLPPPMSTSGINRVEDQESTASPRLSAPSNDAGPGPSAESPELQDPNHTAATERSQK